MTHLDTSPAGVGQCTIAVQTELGNLRCLVCGAANAGKSALIQSLRQALPESSELAATAAVAQTQSPCFRTQRRSYLALEAPPRAADVARMTCDADLALVVIDSRTGVLTQTRRHSYLAALAGIRDLVVAVNKIDAIGYARGGFERIERDYQEFAARIGISDFACVPVSAGGDNIAAPAATTPWYQGPTLIQALDSLPATMQRLRERPFRLLVERVETPDEGVRAIVGSIASGSIGVGERIRVQPGGGDSTVVRITSAGCEVERAFADQPVVLTLANALDVSCGDLASAGHAPASIATQFEAVIVWRSEQPLLPGRTYLLQREGANTVHATVAPLKYKIHVETLEKMAASELTCDELGEVALELDRPIAFDPFVDNPRTGCLELADPIGHEPVGMALLRFALRRADNVHWQALAVDRRARQALAGHRSGVVWMTGLSGAGKSTLANMLEKRLHARGMRTYLLDGDNVRHGLNKDLGFTAADRVENIRRVAEVAKLMADAGIIVITAFISPFRAERRMARELLNPGEFIEVFVDAPLAVAERRDPKGLYAKARRGQLKNFTGIDSPYEAPENPEVRVDTGAHSVERATQEIYDALVRQRFVDCE